MKYSRRNFIKNSSLATASIPFLSFINKQSNTTDKKVIVIGAGLAGLVCAYELGQAGYNVKVLEAQGRVGGCVKTVRNAFKNGQYADVGGASFYPIAQDYAMKYLEKFRLNPVTPQSGRGLSNTLFFNGREKFQLAFPLTDEEIELGINGMKEKYLKSGLDELWESSKNNTIGEVERKYDKISFAELMMRNGASPEAVRLLNAMGVDCVGEGPELYSAANMIGMCFNVSEQNSTYSGVHYSIDGGNDLLPKAFAENLKGELRLNVQVTHIKRTNNGVEVTYSENGNNSSDSSNYVVLAIPPGPTNDIVFDPPLSQSKDFALKNAKMASISRVFYQTESRIWRELGKSGNALTDLPITYFWDCTEKQSGTSGIIHGYMMGPHARHFERLDDKQKKKYTLDQFDLLFPGVSEHLIASHYEIWDSNPFSQGAYVYFQPEQMQSVYPYLSRNEGRIIFAGSHTASKLIHSSMQGALESGLRATSEIINFEK